MKGETEMTYKIYDYGTKFVVWATAPNGNGRAVKTFKTRKGAENWIKKNS